MDSFHLTNQTKNSEQNNKHRVLPVSDAKIGRMHGADAAAVGKAQSRKPRNHVLALVQSNAGRRYSS